MDKRIGQIAYEAYANARSNKTHDGKPMPEWDALGDVQIGWDAAAKAVYEYGYNSGSRNVKF